MPWKASSKIRTSTRRMPRRSSSFYRYCDPPSSPEMPSWPTLAVGFRPKTRRIGDGKRKAFWVAKETCETRKGREEGDEEEDNEEDGE